VQEKNKQSVFSVEATQLEIDPRILEEERIEEELLRKELEEEVLKKLMEEEEAKSKLKSDTTVALNEMLSKKHYQSTVSIRYEILKFLLTNRKMASIIQFKTYFK